MTSQDPNGVQIGRVESGAIRVEIGERLRATLKTNPIPPYLVRLTERFDVAEDGDIAGID